MNIKKIIVIVLSVILIIIITFILFTSINNKRLSTEIANIINKKWGEAVNVENQPRYLAELNSLSRYDVNSVKEVDGVYVVKTTVSAPDLGSVMKRFDYNNLPHTENAVEINDFLCEQLRAAEIVKTEAYIYAYKEGDTYQISFSDEFVDAMCGKLHTYAQSAFVDMMQNYLEGELK